MIRWTPKELKYVLFQEQRRLTCTDFTVQTVRRDNCRLVVTVIETCLKKLLIDRDVKGAEE